MKAAGHSLPKVSGPLTLWDHHQKYGQFWWCSLCYRISHKSYPLVVAVVFSQFPRRIWSLVTSLVLSLCLSVTYGLLARAGERYKRSSKVGSRGGASSTRRCPTAGAIGAVLFPVNKGPCVQAAIQLLALSLAVIFHIAVYFGVAERWVGVFVAMLWVPALRGLDSAMNVFTPAQLFECSFTNLFYTFCIFIPNIIFLSDKPRELVAQDIKWFNVAYALIPPLSFFRGPPTVPLPALVCH